MSKVDRNLELFGDKSLFALEVRLLSGPADSVIPHDSAGSWGEWRLWVANLNLCSLQIDTERGLVDISEVRWFLAPLFRWIITNWIPLLHETHLPGDGRWGDRHPRRSRLAYLAILESAGDNHERFEPWQNWAARHAIRSAAEGGIVPDVFFQRVGDDIEISWGDRVQPGAGSASFLVEDGVARVAVDVVAATLSSAVRWFLEQEPVKSSDWGSDLENSWCSLDDKPVGMTALHWYLDSAPDPGPLSHALMRALHQLDRPIDVLDGLWWGTLAPEVVMFGDLAPQISQLAAVELLTAYFDARVGSTESPELARLVSDEPAWASASPWDNGYALALDVLDAADPDQTSSATRIDALLEALGIRVRDVALGGAGPRGVALAGGGLQATILVNKESPLNKRHGRRFTLAHELCHILYDRVRARPLTHSSTPWASPSIEQRANAFAAMVLMPPHRTKRPETMHGQPFKDAITRLAERLGVSGVSLKHHLANIGEISSYERDYLLGSSRIPYG